MPNVVKREISSDQDKTEFDEKEYTEKQWLLNSSFIEKKHRNYWYGNYRTID